MKSRFWPREAQDWIMAEPCTDGDDKTTFTADFSNLVIKAFDAPVPPPTDFGPDRVPMY
jgi:hypothetical protein